MPLLLLRQGRGGLPLLVLLLGYRLGPLPRRQHRLLLLLRGV
jgi:hypothetical protein